jgi:hypothetical protein
MWCSGGSQGAAARKNRRDEFHKRHCQGLAELGLANVHKKRLRYERPRAVQRGRANIYFDREFYMSYNHMTVN